MAKGYWIGHVDIEDVQTYEKYKEANAIPFAEFGARFLIRGGTQVIKEGQGRTRTVVIEFPSYQAALDCYDSASYQAAKAIRDPISTGDIMVVEGYED